MRITEVSEASIENYEILKNGLNGFNERHTGVLRKENSTGKESVSCFIKDENDQTVGGILGEINWGWLYVQGLWVSDKFRAKGFGSALLRKLEDHARSKGVTNFRLETTSFQALDFYKKQGYEVFGQLPDMPPTFTSYFLKKQVG